MRIWTGIKKSQTGSGNLLNPDWLICEFVFVSGKVNRNLQF